MSTTVDNRVVEMQFNNENFEKNVKTSMNTLEKLKAALKLDGQTKGLNEVSKAASKVSFDGMTGGLETVKTKFSALQIVGITTLQEITKAALTAGKNIASNLITPLISGGLNRAMNIEQAKFQLKGLGIAWQDISEDINYGVQDTAYGLDSAAKVASQLVASGVTLGDNMKTSLRAVSGVAAMTNSEYSEIGEIFTTVAGQGKLMTMQLRQMEARGLNAAAQIGKVMGKSEAEVRDMVTKGKIDFQTFANAMDEAFGEHAKDANETYAGSLSNVKSALARIGADVQAAKLEDLRDIFNALRPVINGVHSALGPFITDLTGLMRLGTDKLVGVLDSLVTTTESADGKKTTQLIAPLLHAFESLTATSKNLRRLAGDILKPIGEALREAFPENIPNAISRTTAAMAAFTSKLSISDRSVGNIKNTFKGLFAMFDIGLQGIKAVVRVLSDEGLFSGVSSFMSGLLESSGGLGEFISNTAQAWKENDTLYRSLKKVVGMFSGFTNAIKTVVAGVLGFADKVKNISNIGDILESIGRVFKGLPSAISKASTALQNFFKTDSSDKSSGLFSFFGTFTTNFNFFKDTIVGISSTIAQVILSISDAFKKVFGDFSFEKLFTGLKNGIQLGILTELYTILQNYTTGVSTGPILQIAEALAILTGSLILLSSVDANKMTQSLAAISAAFGILTGALLILKKAGVNTTLSDVSNPLTILKNTLNRKFGDSLIGVTTALIQISGALLIMAGAIKMLSSIDFKSMVVGLVGLAGAMAILVVGVKALSSIDGSTKKATTGLIKMGIALVIFASAVKSIGKMDPEKLVQGLVGIGIILSEIALFAGMMKVVDKGLGGVSVSMIAIGIALNIFASAISKLGTTDPDGLMKGITSIAAILAEIVIFGKAMEMSKRGLLSTAIAMIGIGAAITILVANIRSLAKIDANSLLKGLGSMGVLLTEIALFSAMTSPIGLIAIGAGLIAFSAGAAILTGVLKSLGKMKTANIAKGLIALGVALGVILAAGAAAMFVGVGLIALAGSFVLLGAGCVGLGVGLNLIATGIGALGVAFATGSTAIVAGITAILVSIISLIPMLATALVQGIGTFLKTLATEIATLIPAITAILSGLLDALNQIVPQFIDVAVNIVTALLNGIASHAGEISASAIQLMIGLLDAIGSYAPQLIDSGINLMVNFIDGMANGIRNNTDKVLSAVKNLISAILEFSISALQEVYANVPIIGDKIVSGLESAKQTVHEKLAPEDGAKAGSDYMKATADGISSQSETANSAASGVLDNVVSTFQNGTTSALDAGGLLGINLGDGLSGSNDYVMGAANSLTSNLSSGLSAVDLASIGQTSGTNYGAGLSKGDVKTGIGSIKSNVTSGLQAFQSQYTQAGTIGTKNYASGISTGSGAACSQAGNLAKQAANAASSNTGGFHTAGVNGGRGFANGLSSMTGSIVSTAGSLGSRALSALKASLGIHSPSKKAYEAGNFTIIGFVNALKDGVHSVVSSMSTVGNSSMNALKSAFGSIGTIIDSDIDTTPVITPIINMDEMTEKIAKIKETFGGPILSLIDSSQIDKLGGLAENIKMGEISNRLNMDNMMSDLNNVINTLANSINNHNTELIGNLYYLMSEYYPDFAKGLRIDPREASNKLYKYTNYYSSRDEVFKQRIEGNR